MTTVFLSGSRKIGRIGKEVRQRLDNMIENQLEIITGDANGADKAMQAYLASRSYKKIKIFYVGGAPRNNVGHWQAKKVENINKLKGREFYAQKDYEMSKVADYGFVLWDGKSSGSVQNMIWLVSNGKKVVVYYTPEKSFLTVVSEEDLVRLLSRLDRETISALGRKIELPSALKSVGPHQTTLAL